MNQRKGDKLSSLANDQLLPREELYKRYPRNIKLNIGIPDSSLSTEYCVPLTPQSVELLVYNGHDIFVESGAGKESNYSDKAYSEAGAVICKSAAEIFQCDIILKMAPFTMEESELMKGNQLLFSPLYLTFQTQESVRRLMRKKVTAVGFEYMKDENGIFPGTGLNGHDVKGGVYNWALTSLSGDVEFLDAMQEIELLADEIQPDVILLAAGADAHYSDPLSSLTFDYPGYRAAARIVGDISNKHAKGRVLIGGAGGYQPFDHTPNVWATVVSEIYSTINNVAV